MRSHPYLCAAAALFLALLTQAAPAIAQNSGAKAMKLRLGFFNGPAATCDSATPCQDVKADAQKEYYSYLDDGYVQSISKISDSKSPEEFQKALLDYYDGLAARDKVLGTCYGRCTNYDQPEMLWHATTETARNQKLDALIDTKFVYYGADTLVKNGMDVTSQIKVGLKKYRR